jgi:hypothetical protein
MSLYGYHATNIKNSKSILKNGFNPIEYAYQHSNPKIKRLYWTWFSHYPQYVYGRVCLKVDLSDLKCVVNDNCIICKELYISPDRIIEVLKD